MTTVRTTRRSRQLAQEARGHVNASRADPQGERSCLRRERGDGTGPDATGDFEANHWTYDGAMGAASDRAFAESAIATRNGGARLVVAGVHRPLPVSAGLTVRLRLGDPRGHSNLSARHPAASRVVAARSHLVVFKERGTDRAAAVLDLRMIHARCLQGLDARLASNMRPLRGARRWRRPRLRGHNTVANSTTEANGTVGAPHGYCVSALGTGKAWAARPNGAASHPD